MQEKDNYLKNAELGTEQNYNMIDGILNNELTPRARAGAGAAGQGEGAAPQEAQPRA